MRAGIHQGAQVFAIREGWQGAIEGGEHIAHLGWSDVSGILNKGGTVIGTARSTGFRTREGQLLAVENLVRAGIDRLIVIGGDGSLTAAVPCASAGRATSPNWRRPAGLLRSRRPPTRT
ncbi:hypothetical protein G7085_00920 [Tessaracoccus sp. HDW20]|nr:hypothetical protein [Tessaracoccus coleopterorum]